MTNFENGVEKDCRCLYKSCMIHSPILNIDGKYHVRTIHPDVKENIQRKTNQSGKNETNKRKQKTCSSVAGKDAIVFLLNDIEKKRRQKMEIKASDIMEFFPGLSLAKAKVFAGDLQGDFEEAESESITN